MNKYSFTRQKEYLFDKHALTSDTTKTTKSIENGITLLCQSSLVDSFGNPIDTIIRPYINFPANDGYGFQATRFWNGTKWVQSNEADLAVTIFGNEVHWILNSYWQFLDHLTADNFTLRAVPQGTVDSGSFSALIWRK